MAPSWNDLRVHVIKLVRQTVKEHASTATPTFDEIRTALKLDVKENQLPPRIDGMIEGDTIIVNSAIHNNERKEFTRFHEVMHYLIKVDEDLISKLHEVPSNQNGEYDRQIEQLCNIGAAEFLMSSEQFRKLYKELEFNVKAIPFASRYFRASAIATTIQLAQIAPNSCISAVCEYGTLSNETPPTQENLLDVENVARKPTLYVAYSASSPSTKYLLAKNTRIPEDHLIHRAFLNSEAIEEKSYVPFRSGKKMPCYCEALRDKDRDRVFVIFHLTPPPNSNQLTFI